MQLYQAAVIQMNSQPDVDSNLEQARHFIKEASGRGARLVGLPENFAFLGDLPSRIEKAAAICKKAEEFLVKTAQDMDIYLLGGGHPVPAGNGKVYNRSLLIDPNGDRVAQYDKIHLFDVDLKGGESYRESDDVKAGNTDPVVNKSDEIGNIGLSICYDIRFPELYRLLSAREADLLTIPAAFTETTGKVHWEPLLRARAIENTAYVFAPAQTGTHGRRRRTYGHAMIIDPWGEILVDVGDKPGIGVAEINPGRLKAARKSIPSLKHRRINYRLP